MIPSIRSVLAPASALLCTLILAVAVDASAPAEARFWSRSEKWCARMNGGFDDCSYFTLEQCRKAASGNGNTCLRNPLYKGAQTERPARRQWRGR
jgi:hypothetical protein